MEIQGAMACPVCTLYLREGMSMQSHLNTHPKDQVIEALVRLYTSESRSSGAGTGPPPPFIQMVSEEQIVLGRQQVTSFIHPQVVSYPIYQPPPHYLTSESRVPESESPASPTIQSQPSDNYQEPNAEMETIITTGSNVIISTNEEDRCEVEDTKTEVYISEPVHPPTSPYSQTSNHSGITVRTDLTNPERNFNEDMANQYITSDCDYQDEDARHSEDIINIDLQEPVVYCEEEDDGELQSKNLEDGSMNSCSGLNIQADERMPARGELSGQGSLGNTVSSVWIDETPMVTTSVWEDRDSADTKRRYQCLYCGQDFSCPKERRIHIATIHSNPDTKKVLPREAVCPKCGLQAPTMKAIKEHMRTEHKRVCRECAVCHEVFPTQELFTEHLSKVHPLECTTCGKTFHTKSGLTLHTKIHLPEKPHACTLCKKTFTTAQKMREHMNSHTGYAPLQCNMCDRKFKRYSNLKQHKDVAHFKVKKKLKEYFCDCGEAFPTRKKLAWHKETHLEKPRQCSFCSEKYVHSASLTRHIRKMHDSHYLPPEETPKTKNVQCPVCNLVFLESSLRAHMRQHSSTKQFGCIICGKKFHTKWNLHLHRWTHASRISKPYKCNQCKGAFIRLGDFQAHIRSHFGQKPFTCNHCGMQFSRKQNWQRHEKEHTGEKNFTCGECGKTFHRSYYLIEHARIHTGVKPYSCHICNKTSTTKSNHNKHVRTHHARETVNTEG